MQIKYRDNQVGLIVNKKICSSSDNISKVWFHHQPIDNKWKRQLLIILRAQKTPLNIASPACKTAQIYSKSPTLRVSLPKPVFPSSNTTKIRGISCASNTSKPFWPRLRCYRTRLGAWQRLRCSRYKIRMTSILDLAKKAYDCL